MFESVGAAGFAKGCRVLKATSLKFVDRADWLGWFWHDAEVDMSSFACCMLRCHHQYHFTPHVSSLNNVIFSESQEWCEFVEQFRDIFDAEINVHRRGGRESIPRQPWHNQMKGSVSGVLHFTQLVQHRQALDETPQPAVEQNQRNCIWLLRQDGGKVN